MKRFLPLILFLFALLWTASSWRPSKPVPNAFDLDRLGKIPVLVGGRAKPLDTVARNSLLIIHGKESMHLAHGETVSPMRWLVDVAFIARTADQYPVFVVQNADVLGLFAWQQTDRKYFSYSELRPFLPRIEEQGALSAKLQSVERSAYQTAVLNLRNTLVLYQQLKNSLQPEDAKNWAREVATLEKGAFSNDTVDRAVQRAGQFAETAYILPVPPVQDESAQWHSMGDAILKPAGSEKLHPVVTMYARLGDAWRSGNSAEFDRETTLLSDWIAQHQPTATKRASFESFFNHVDPFMHSMVLYMAAFLLACASWLVWSRALNRSAFYLLLLALAIHTVGLVARMYLQERPPVTNLYSSAIFIGWGAVIVALILERIFRDGIGAACAGALGFITLIIAHHLAGSGDTLEMLQAVLDTNIWLATHVVAITTGYSAMFLAGMLAIIYIMRGVFTRSLTAALARSLTRMTYGVICFATLFSFVGTVLGGIWADQSWGRFWGWDPKENGAVLIVLWCAMILHARWGGFIGQRGLMIMAVFGNVITSFSWFGVNMLGVGLHSYGFMEKAFPWLCGFIVSQLALMAVAAKPLDRWRSFRKFAQSQSRIKFTPPELAIETK